MSLELLLPVEELAVAHTVLQSDLSLGKNIKIHSKQDGLPDLKNVQIAILGITEGRGAVDNIGTGKGLDIVRKYIYQMFPGNWHMNVADLGNVPNGKDIGDSYFVIQEIIGELLEKNIIPVIIGGSQDITYAGYRAYDRLKKPVNIVSVDNRFDLGEMNPKLNSHNYLHYIVMDKPNNMFNFSNIGFQTFFNSQEEIDLMDKLYFDAYRLGQVTNDITSVEPVLRDADIVSIDMGAVRISDAPANNNAVPNGFFGDQICAISRYAGISNKVSSFGIYEFNPKFDQRENTAHLIAQMVWYFIEGVNLRIEEYPLESVKSYKKYIVLVEDQTINFYKSNKSERWWMEIHYHHNNSDKSTLIPCTYHDYLTANNQIIPERWLKTFRKLN
ncbi:formimidoylglutamase [Lutimonas zeaxanthinifaciens]|uniref:formimidoylglutamase n=1 Tax=Lutimonas zeaxanthinifaciens TaxID=3060215 RepID=UPI00265D0DB9|nr:formimidoylglutamase [Lutimonas sp. YSD2104]WKK65272.1 formimidoylglutamase [Lutimonas sp. YSD2104]